jgi:hypothetical protein|nr:MAG: hypothetical protein [Microvirus sp.]
MRPVRRKHVRKAKSIHRFRKQAARTQKRNVVGPMRGGLRI